LTESSLTETILTVLVLAASYLLLVSYTTHSYKEYVMDGSSREIGTLLVVIILMSIGIPLILVYLTISFLVLMFLAFLISLVAISMYRVRVMWQAVCKGEERRVVDNVEYFLCSTRVLDVWYRSGKVYVSRLLAERLAIDELKVIVHREAARAKNKRLSLISTYSYWMWSLILAGMLFILLFVNRLSLPLQQLLIVITFLYWLATVYTLFAVVSSWVVEHELDKYATINTNSYTAIAAFVKVETYVKLAGEGLLEAIDELRVRDIANNREIIMRNLRFSTLFFTLLKHSLLYPRWIVSYMLNPTYPSRPPLWLRVAVLLHSLSQQPR